MTLSAKPKAAFIDRDGVINEERNYVYRIEDFVLLPGVIEGLSLLRDAGYRLIVVTNQAGIARGIYDHAATERLHRYVREQLSASGIVLDGIYFCPHHPCGSVKEFAVECGCRKPAPGMLLQAKNDFDLDLASSVLIGDKVGDVQAGKRAGVGRTVLVESGHALASSDLCQAEFVAKDLLAAARTLTLHGGGM